MPPGAIDKILEAGRKAEPPPAANENHGGKFYSILVGEPVQEQFLELRFRIGIRACLNYSELSWFIYDPESGKLDLEFGSMFVTVTGRGLGGKVFAGIKQKRVSWIAEADSEMQDSKENEVFIATITVAEPSSGATTEEKAA